MKYAEMKPLSKPTPSVISSSVLSVDDSSTRDHAVVADLGHRLTDQLADLLVARGHGGDLRDPGLVGDRGGRRQQRLGHRVGGLADARAERDRVGAGGDVAQPGLDQRLCQHGRGGGAVAGDVVGLGGHRLHQLRAQVLERVLQVDLAGDGDAVVGDRRAAERLGQHHVPAARTQRHPDRVGELVDAGFHCAARGFVELNQFAHMLFPDLSIRMPPRKSPAVTGISGAEHVVLTC